MGHMDHTFVVGRILVRKLVVVGKLVHKLVVVGKLVMVGKLVVPGLVCTRRWFEEPVWFLARRRSLGLA